MDDLSQADHHPPQRHQLPRLSFSHYARVLRDIAPVIAVAAVVLGALWWMLLVDAAAVVIAGIAVLLTAVAMRAGPISELREVRSWLVSAAEVDREPPNVEVGDLLADHVITPAMALRRGLHQQRRLARSYAALIERFNVTLPDPCFLVTPELVVVSPNQAARRVFDLVRERTPLALVIRDPNMLSGVTAALSSGEQTQLMVSRADDPDRRYAATIEPMQFLDSRPGVLVILREDHEQVMIERMRSDFIANVSHELRTPLTAFTGFVETLQGPAADDPEARAQFLAMMQDEAGRMTRLVNDLLSLSKLETTVSSPPTSRCEIGKELRRAVDTMEPLARAGGVDLDFVGVAGTHWVRADVDQLHQLFCNLIENAIKYGGVGTSVRLRVRAHAPAPSCAGPLANSRAIEIAVEDQGPGIERRHIPRLTERFYRVDKGRSRNVGGTGLGLAIVKHILRRHGGHLHVVSVVGQGSTFSVFLPLSSDAAMCTDSAVTKLS